MKTYFVPTLKKSLFVLLAFTFSACSEEVSLIEEEVVEQIFQEPAIPEVHTKQPDVGKDVLFKGELKSLGTAKKVEYGFMWYDPNANEVVIEEVKVGVTNELLDFDQLMTGLPDKPSLIVCSFARVESTQETVIGEEVKFDPSL